MSPQSSIRHYGITAKLCDGGMGAVYRATDTKLNREAAVQVLPSAFGQDPDRVAPPFPTVALAPDGKHFAVTLYPDGTAEHQPTVQLTFLFNFFDELRRLVPVKGK